MNRDRLILLLTAPLIVAAGIARAACAELPVAIRELGQSWNYLNNDRRRRGQAGTTPAIT